MKSYESFSTWLEDQSPKNQTLIVELKKLIEDIAPYLTTTVKWGQGCWLNNNKPVLYIHTEPEYLQLGFYSGSTLQDPQSILKGKGKYVRFIEITDTSEIDVPVFTKLIEQVV